MDITWDSVGEGALLAGILLIVFGLGKSLAAIGGIEAHLWQKRKSVSREYKQAVRESALDTLWDGWVEITAGLGAITVLLFVSLFTGSLTNEGWSVFGLLWGVLGVPMILLYLLVSRIYRTH